MDRGRGAAGSAGRTTTASALAARACACSTCRLPSAWPSATSGSPAWTRRWRNCRCRRRCGSGSTRRLFRPDRRLDAEPVGRVPPRWVVP